MRNIALLGSTGSIGRQSLSVCEFLGVPVKALCARSNAGLLAEQARRFKPALVGIEDESRYKELKTLLADTNVKVIAGKGAAGEAAALGDADFVLNALVGIAGLRPALAAIEAGKTLALANKECLVAGGSLVMEAAAQKGVQVLPVDSEHSAIFQCLQAGMREDVRGIILTASGGPFFGKKRGELMDIAPEQALCHPNWKMGPKITVDCATMMNKGLELIEAMWFFGLEASQVEIVVHRQSAIHSAVEFCDGSIIAQLGALDMRSAIQYAITYPRHFPRGNGRLSLAKLGALTFHEPDYETFACLKLCIDAANAGGLAPCVASGANEAAVELFLEGKLSFLGIGDAVAAALRDVRPQEGASLEAIEDADLAAREHVKTNYGKR
jgi:1-deoxy-D-xylulose-5-phosphate reductoisomerase